LGGAEMTQTSQPFKNLIAQFTHKIRAICWNEKAIIGIITHQAKPSNSLKPIFEHGCIYFGSTTNINRLLSARCYLKFYYLNKAELKSLTGKVLLDIKHYELIFLFGHN
jgi:hypothetical protein